MQRLPLPIAVSGLSSSRFTQLAGWLDDDGPVARASGGVDAAAVPAPMVAGGNLAASLSDGTVTMAAVGTATYVCGDDVLGFGHPLAFAGDSTYTLRGADAITIQPDVAISSFKLANLGAPVGTVVEDRLTGIRGVLGALPTTYDVSSSATYRGRDKSGVTHVSVPDMLADLSLSTIVAMSATRPSTTWARAARRRRGPSGAPAQRTPSRSTTATCTPPAATSPSRRSMDLATQVYALTENRPRRSPSPRSPRTRPSTTTPASERGRPGPTAGPTVPGVGSPRTAHGPAARRARARGEVPASLARPGHAVPLRHRHHRSAPANVALLTIVGGGPSGTTASTDLRQEFYDEIGFLAGDHPQVLKSFATARERRDEATLQVRGSDAATTSASARSCGSPCSCRSSCAGRPPDGCCRGRARRGRLARPDASVVVLLGLPDPPLMPTRPAVDPRCSGRATANSSPRRPLKHHQPHGRPRPRAPSPTRPA